MKKGDIKLSKKHGVNPMVVLCFICNEETNEIALLGKLPDDEEAPHKGVLDTRPCEKCLGWMEKGVILISVRDGEAGENPYRTGGWCVLKDEAVQRLASVGVDRNVLGDILKKRMAFIEDAVWDMIRLPRNPTEDV